MKRFIEGESRAQATLFPERLDDWIAEDNPVRAVDAFVDELDLAKLGFEGAEPAARAGLRTTPARCSRSTSTATSTACPRAGAWSARRSATSS